MLHYTHYNIHALPSFHGTALNNYHGTFFIFTVQGIHTMYITTTPVLIPTTITIRYNHTRILPHRANRERKTVCEVPTLWRYDEPNAKIHKDFP
jgi:hypothetical protein